MLRIIDQSIKVCKKIKIGLIGSPIVNYSLSVFPCFMWNYSLLQASPFVFLGVVLYYNMKMVKCWCTIYHGNSKLSFVEGLVLAVDDAYSSYSVISN